MSDFPAEPLQVNFTAQGNSHRFIRVSPLIARLEPGKSDLIFGLVVVALGPVGYFICWRLHAPLSLAIGISLMPVVAGIAHLAGHFFYSRFGTRVEFDRSGGVVMVTGARHGQGVRLPYGAIRAVQLCDVRKGGSGAGQINLIVEGAGTRRINLLQNSGVRQLRRIGKEMAEFLNVPFYRGSHVA